MFHKLLLCAPQSTREFLLRRFIIRVGNTPARGRIANAAYNEQARRKSNKKATKTNFFCDLNLYFCLRGYAISCEIA